MPKRIDIKDLIGKKYGRLTVIEETTPNILPGGTQRLIACECDCGKRVIKRLSHVASGNSRSCGCYRRDKNTEDNTSHDMSKTTFYKVWRGMKNRCYRKSTDGYPGYGGRGIAVCKRWKDSFENFRDDMLPTYKRGLQIDRIDNDGPYSPDNCRWVTNKENSRNKRTNRSHRGKSMVEWAEVIGINYGTLRSRIRLGWSWEKALSTPVMKSQSRKHQAD